MKKLSFLMLLLLASISFAHAQTEKGGLMVGGTGGLNFLDLSEETGAGTIFSFSIAPNVGYFVTDGLAVGAAVGLGFSNNDNSNSSNFSFGPFARYYINLGDAALKPFATAGVGFSRSTFNPDQGDKVTRDGTSLQLGIGATYFLTRNVGLEAILGYNNINEKSDLSGFESENKFSNIGLNFGFQIFLGGNE